MNSGSGLARCAATLENAYRKRAKDVPLKVRAKKKDRENYSLRFLGVGTSFHLNFEERLEEDSAEGISLPTALCYSLPKSGNDLHTARRKAKGELYEVLRSCLVSRKRIPAADAAIARCVSKRRYPGTPEAIYLIRPRQRKAEINPRKKGKTFRCLQSEQDTQINYIALPISYM